MLQELIAPLLVFTVLLAAVIDVIILSRLKRSYTRRAPAPDEREGSVYIFGEYSPVLTWLRRGWRLVLPAAWYRLRTVSHGLLGSIRGASGFLQDRRLPDSAGKAAPAAFEWAAGKRVLLEWLFIFLAVLAFCGGFLDFRPYRQLPGNESLLFQSLDWVFINSIAVYQKFPLWNPHFYAGVPYIADPMTHILNPVVLIPVLIFGVDSGFKLAIFASFLIAAYGTWRLGAVLGLSPLTRVWMALMYAFAGQPAARFFQGQYLFVLGFAWIPWITGSLILLTRRRRVTDLIGAAAALAILFFSGNVYYQVYMAAACFLFAAVFLPSFSLRKPFLRLDKQLVGLIALTGFLALGLAAVQLFPTVEFAGWLRKGPEIHGSHTVPQILLDLTSKDSHRPDAYSVLPAREEFYAYIGWFPVLSLPALLFAAAKKEFRRPLLFFAALLLFTVLWINVPRLPFSDWLLEGALFHQLRHLLRILLFTSFAIICLAALGLDALLQRLSASFRESPVKFLLPIGQGILLLLLGCMVFSVYDLYSTNRKHLATQEANRPGFLVMGWLRQYDNAVNYVRFNPHNSGYDFAISNQQRLLEAWYHYNNIRSLEGNIFPKEITARPHYLVQGVSEPVDYPDAEFLREVEGYSIYRLTDSLPFAFTVKTSTLQQADGERLTRRDVQALPAYPTGPNTVEVIAESRADEYLILLISNYKGWRVEIDGKPGEIVNAGGYLGVKAGEGVHKYAFSYRPAPFYAGLGVSLVCLGLSIFLLVAGQREQLAALPGRLRNGLVWAAGRWTRLGNRWRGWKAWWSSSLVEARSPEGKAAVGAARAVDTAAESAGAGIPRLEPLPLSISAAAAAKLGAIFRLWGLEKSLFVLGLLLYAATRFTGLERFPIYFFTDEAIQTVMAADFVRDGFTNYSGEFFPAFFSNGSTYNLSSISVYLQVIPYLLFGKSVVVTRGVSALVSLLAAVFVSLALKNIFRVRHWWVGALLLSITPAWFLHSRTAFETVEMVSFYAGFLYFYMLYLDRSPKYLYPALVFGALVFYTYSPGQLIIGLSGVLLLVSDLPYHIKNRKTALRGFLLLVLLAMPYIGYIQSHPDVTISHLSTRAPFWTADIPFSEKLGRYFSEYLYGLSPGYWYSPEPVDLNRHLMDGYGHIMWWTLPFACLGLLKALKEIGKPACRALLIAVLVAPSGAALVGIGVTRALVFVVPAAVLTALGVSGILEVLENPPGWLRGAARIPSIRFDRRLAAFSVFAVLALINTGMLRDALANGPTWYTDYTLYGMQYGASQVFGKVNEYLAEHPGSKLVVSPNWTNGADAVARFFLKEGTNVTLGSVTGHIDAKRPLDERTVFVVMKEEFDQVVQSGKFKEISVDEDYTVVYPNGEPGFYFVRLAYRDDIDRIFEKEREARKTLLEGTAVVEGILATVRHPHLDAGEIAHVFDGDVDTYARTMEANPFVIELDFAEPLEMSGVAVTAGSIYGELTAYVTAGGHQEPDVFAIEEQGSVEDPEFRLEFGETIEAVHVRLEVREVGIDEPAHIHIWEVEFMH